MTDQEIIDRANSMIEQFRKDDIADGIYDPHCPSCHENIVAVAYYRIMDDASFSECAQIYELQTRAIVAARGGMSL